MLGIESLAIFFTILGLSTIFLFVKRKTIEILVMHLLIMLFSIILGALIVLPDNQIVGIFAIFYSVVAFVATVLMTEV